MPRFFFIFFWNIFFLHCLSLCAKNFQERFSRQPQSFIERCFHVAFFSKEIDVADRRLFFGFSLGIDPEEKHFAGTTRCPLWVHLLRKLDHPQGDRKRKDVLKKDEVPWCLCCWQSNSTGHSETPSVRLDTEVLMSPFFNIEILFPVNIYWKDDPDGNLAISCLNLCCDSGCRKRAGCRTCIFSRGSRAVLTIALAVVFLKTFLLQCRRTQAQQQLRQLKEELLSQDISLWVMLLWSIAEVLQENKGVLMLQLFFLGFKWQKHPLKGNEQSFMKLRRSRCRGKLFKTKKMNLKSERCVDNKLIVSFIRLP